MLKFIKKALEPESETLIGLLDKHLSGYRKGRSVAEIRASMLTHQETEFCPREIALLDLTKKTPKDQYVGMATRVAFDQGDALHYLVRNVWLGDLVIGDWKCMVCGGKLLFSTKPKQPCFKCKNNLWEYQEIRVYSPVLDVSGGLDTLIKLGPQQKTKLVEIKTMDKDQFAKIVAPMAEHKQRTQFYLHLVRTSTQPFTQFIDQDVAKVLYVSKAYGKKDEILGKISPFKEYNVEYSAANLAMPVIKALRLKEFRDGTKGVPKGICPNSMVPRVKKCAVPAECFSGKYPPQDE